MHRKFQKFYLDICCLNFKITHIQTRTASHSLVSPRFQCTDQKCTAQEKRWDMSALGVDALAQWLDDSRPIDQSGAYSMLLLGLSALFLPDSSFCRSLSRKLALNVRICACMCARASFHPLLGCTHPSPDLETRYLAPEHIYPLLTPSQLCSQGSDSSSFGTISSRLE